ncbi:MAG: Rrf2 family transcriptional regulator [Clostridia bacterium]|nr:Rrf2 family transcriptional regulator [Clostridia bacterium]
MKISTKVEFGIIAMIDIAIYSENHETDTVDSIAKRQNISGKYLEQILTVLRQAKLIRGLKGSKGGYVITRPADKITLKEIIDALDLTILSCADFSTQYDSLLFKTVDVYVWDKMTDFMQEYAKQLTLAQLVDHYRQAVDESQEQLMYYI